MLTVSMLSFVTMAEETNVDALLDLILQDTGTVKNTTTSTWTTTPVLPVVLAPALTPAEDTEFNSAITWMYTNWLTQFSTAATFEPANLLTRQQAAKFFVMLQESYVWVPLISNTNCTFKDTWFDSTLRTFVDKACAYGIMQGQNAIFRPTAVISKPEFVASLVRIMEWAKRDETTNPWWLWYFQQARDWGLTKEQNANAFDTPMSRYESALFLYRASRMIQKPTSLNTGNNTPSTTGNTTTPTSPVTTWWNTSANQSLTSVVSDPALQEAIYWMYDNGITKYDNVENYRPFDSITRQEAAKIFTLFRNTIIQGTPDSAGINCAFTDMDLADPTLVNYITDACKLQILKWSNGLFNPLAILTKPQAVAILVRMLEWNQDETTNPRWQGYYDRAIAMWMIQQSTSTNFDKPITRYEVAMLLYNSKIKYELIKNLNNNFETNKLIYTVPDTVTTWSSIGEKTGLISINTQIMERSDINGYTIDLFGEQYVLEKTATQKYLNSDYVWYGKIFSLDKTTAVWTAALTMSNGVVISWVLRPYNILSKTYYITPSSKQPYYTMVMKKR